MLMLAEVVYDGLKFAEKIIIDKFIQEGDNYVISIWTEAAAEVPAHCMASWSDTSFQLCRLQITHRNTH